MSVKHISIAMFVLLALAAGLITFLVKRNDIYHALEQQAEQVIQQGEQQPVLNNNSANDRGLPQERQKSGSKTTGRDDKRRGAETPAKDDQRKVGKNADSAKVGEVNTNRPRKVEYHSSDRKLVALEYFGEGGKRVRRDIYDDQERLRLSLFYNSTGMIVVREQAFDENGVQIRSRAPLPLGPGRLVY